MAIYPVKDFTRNCDALKDLNGWFESGPTATSVVGTELILRSVRSERAQPSTPESVLDEIVADGWAAQSCPGAPEKPDDGDK
jgi:hypothetical protein